MRTIGERPAGMFPAQRGQLLAVRTYLRNDQWTLPLDAAAKQNDKSAGRDLSALNLK